MIRNNWPLMPNASRNYLIVCLVAFYMFQISSWWWSHGVETCTWVNHYFIKLCFDGLSVYVLFIYQHSGMYKFQILVSILKWYTICVYYVCLYVSMYVCISETPIVCSLLCLLCPVCKWNVRSIQNFVDKGRKISDIIMWKHLWNSWKG